MSKIAIIGATGRAGGQLLEEALRRGHAVTAIARNASKLGERVGVTVKDLDVLDAGALQQAVAGHDAVFSAAHFTGIPASAIIGPVKNAGVKRLLVVGGAGSLFARAGARTPCDVGLLDLVEGLAGVNGRALPRLVVAGVRQPDPQGAQAA